MHHLSDNHLLEILATDIRKQVAEGLEHLDVERLTELVPWSRRQMERRFRECYLTSPARYFRDCQWDQARRLLQEGHDVLSASTYSGFASPGRLHDAVVARSGLTPGEMRRGGAGVHIYFGFFQIQLGVVLLAATKRGLSSLRICGAEPSVDDLVRQVEQFQADYPQATIEECPEKLQTYADQLVAFLDTRTAAEFCPPIDVLEGTTFQREVWAELQKIEPGETISYTELAIRVGKPNAVRAVAQACARNQLAIAIPCHRCVRQDGTLAGYRWGIEWKQRLLTIETQRAEYLAKLADGKEPVPTEFTARPIVIDPVR